MSTGISGDTYTIYQNGQYITKTNPSTTSATSSTSSSVFSNVDYSAGYDQVYSNYLNSVSSASTTDATQQTTGTQAVSASGNTCTDGSDDGKIGFFEGVGSFFNGIKNAVVNTVVGIVTDPGKLLMTAGAVALGIAFPPAGVAMAVAGGVAATVQIGTGVVSAATAKTDAEAKDALESVGAGTLQLGMSALGAKAGLKAMSNTTGSAMYQAANSTTKLTLGQRVSAFCKDTVTGGRGANFEGGIINSIKNAWSNPSSGTGYLGTQGISNMVSNIRTNGFFGGIRKSLGDAKNFVSSSLKNAKAQRQANKAAKKYEKCNNKIDELKKQIDDVNNNSKLTDAEKTSKINNLNERIDKLRTEKLDIVDKQVNSAREVKAAKVKCEQLEKAQENSKFQGDGKVADFYKEKLQNNLDNAQQKYMETKLNRRSMFKNAQSNSSKSQSSVEYAQKSVEKAKIKYENACKSGNSAEIKTASENLSKAKADLKQAKYDSPSTSALRQGLNAAGKKASDAGYSENAYNALKWATITPVGVQIDD